ncbi:MAG: 16S rRNA (guanine(527)-N(7))-methyltransferase RsmG [Tsuneonella sp.]
MIYDEKTARSFVLTLGDSTAIHRLGALCIALRDENERQNLVSRGTLDAIWTRHIADSAQLLLYVGGPLESSWLDLGSGAGFPGLVIAILRPDVEVVLVESRRKRVEWLERMRRELGLPNCKVEGGRLELVESFPASVISARAFAPLPKLLDLAARFSTSDTTWVLPKGRSAEQELSELPLHQSRMFHVERSMTDDEALILIGKEASRT